MSLFLNQILGGPEQIDKPFSIMLNKIFQRKDAIEKDYINPEDGELNLVFEYPGSIWRPDFVGIRIGRLSKDKRKIRVRVGFPADKLSLDSFVEQYVVFLKEAILQGKKCFDKKGISFSLENHLALVEKITNDLLQN